MQSRGAECTLGFGISFGTGSRGGKFSSLQNGSANAARKPTVGCGNDLDELPPYTAWDSKL